MGQRPTTARALTGAIEYVGLGALVGGTFLTIVVGVGASLGVDVPNAGLTLAAAVLLAITFEPARRRLHRLANRVVYGHRSSPSEAVRSLAAQIGDDRDPGDLLQQLANVIRAGTAARTVVVWLRLDAVWEPAAGSPGADAESVEVEGDRAPQVRGADLVAPIRHGGELLGAISVAKSGPRSLIPLEQRLVADLAAHAGIAARTLQLKETLRRRLEVLRRQQQQLIASRTEVVLAQDEERRRLERDIHDACQQPALVLAGRLGLATMLADRDPGHARAVLDEARIDVDRVASALSHLTEGAPMPELASAGIAAALRAEAARLPAKVQIDDLIGRRHHPDLEAIIYFCCMEALQNATRHGKASQIRVRLSETPGCVAFSVHDDGVGFDVEHPGVGTGLRNIRERLRARHGRLVVRSSPVGTEISAEVPVAPDGVGT